MSGTVSLLRINMREGLRSLSRAKLRSALGLIGLVIGVGSVITIISIGEIARETSRAEFDTLGTDILIIESANRSGSAAGQGIALDDALRLPDSVPSIVEAAPRIRLHDTLIYAGKALGEGAVHGVTAQFARVNSLALSQGRFISHVDRRRYFCVVGAAFANAMRGGGASTVVGETVAMLGRLFTVVGVLEEATGDYSTSVRLAPDNSAFIPVSTARRILPRAEIDTITARARSDTHPSLAALHVQQWFRDRPESLEVEVTSATQLIEQRESQMRIMTLLLAAIGSIALVVGGIGVMNIMLMSVNERRKEIGIRRALGARRADIQVQFLVESAILCTVGGIIGIVLGTAGTWTICRFTEWDFFVSTEAVVIGLCVSSSIGALFGFQPANQASRVNPISALKTE